MKARDLVVYSQVSVWKSFIYCAEDVALWGKCGNLLAENCEFIEVVLKLFGLRISTFCEF